jgi:hypothetical protein
VTDFWSYGKDFTTMPTYNVYIPTRHHIMNKPDMMDGDKEDLSYRFNMNRLSHFDYLNTMKGYKMSPKPDFRIRFDKPKTKFALWRRLSNTKTHLTPGPRSFSTINNRPEIDYDGKTP